ncbi:MAG: 6-carboxytetrahydropterin synthase [Candidatus Competibacteraceae bacterium]|nr:6-carboxytetrahydropterin synthase [Candidatus Competibacteraceae bacterium]
MVKHSVSVIRQEHFNAAHRLHNPAWDEETNRRIFGLCNLPNFHGHNYELEVKLTGYIDPDTGYVMDMKILSDLIHRKILLRFDHKNLNLDTEEFRFLNPTVENMVVVIYDLLRVEISDDFDLHVRLYETPRNYAEYSGERIIE